MKDQIENNHKKRMNVKYIPSAEKPADLISQGVNPDQFMTKLEFWKHGPSWLTKDSFYWPSSSLECLNSRAKDVWSELYFGTTTKMDTTSIINIERFSTLTKLCNATAMVLEFIHKCSK